LVQAQRNGAGSKKRCRLKETVQAQRNGAGSKTPERVICISARDSLPQPVYQNAVKIKESLVGRYQKVGAEFDCSCCVKRIGSPNSPCLQIQLLKLTPHNRGLQVEHCNIE
jgi:hypothetical protein